MTDGLLPLLDERVHRVRQFLDGVVADPPGTSLELRRRLAAELGFEPGPETLQALTAATEVLDPAYRDVALRSAADHLLLTMAAHEVWESSLVDAERLGAAAEILPSVVLVHREAQEAIARSLSSIGRMHRDPIAKIHHAFELPEEPILAAIVLVPEIERLAAAAADGSLEAAAPSLAVDEASMIEAACDPDLPDADKPPRALLDAVALRTLIESLVAQWREIEATTSPDDDAEIRTAFRARLERVRSAHPVVSHRLDALRARCWDRTKLPDRRLDQTRRRLFGAYLELSKAITGAPAETTDELQARILEAERAGAAIDAERQSTEATMRDAASGAAQPVAPVAVPPSLRDLQRERRRRLRLFGVAAALVPIAIGSNLAYRLSRPAFEPPTTAIFADAMPVQQVVPVGGAMVTKVSAFLWNEWNDAQRAKKVEQLGEIAKSKGYQALVIVDDQGVERARWTARRGPEVRGTDPSVAAP